MQLERTSHGGCIMRVSACGLGCGGRVLPGLSHIHTELGLNECECPRLLITANNRLETRTSLNLDRKLIAFLARKRGDMSLYSSSRSSSRHLAILIHRIEMYVKKTFSLPGNTLPKDAKSSLNEIPHLSKMPAFIFVRLFANLLATACPWLFNPEL